METDVTFRSDRFRPVLPEECQVNPGRYGAELAYWLCTELAKAGVVVSYPNYEDWGWFLEHVTEAGDEYWLCCGNVDGTADEWVCFLEAKRRGIFGRQKADLEHARSLLKALAEVLASEPSIRHVRWSSGER